MENKKLIIGNMKMNLDYLEIIDFIDNLRKKENVVICPTNIYLDKFINKDISAGIQNISSFTSGAYTGEVSAKQAASLGVEYAIIGHSERRQIFNETNKIITDKIDQALANDLKIILCIGESENTRNDKKTKQFIESQLKEALSNINSENAKNLIIAYEPIWAIGTGIVPTNDEIEETINFINEFIYSLIHLTLPVLYGGSVNDINVVELNKIKNVSGYLIGGAACDYHKLNKIIEEVNK